MVFFLLDYFLFYEEMLWCESHEKYSLSLSLQRLFGLLGMAWAKMDPESFAFPVFFSRERVSETRSGHPYFRRHDSAPFG